MRERRELRVEKGGREGERERANRGVEEKKPAMNMWRDGGGEWGEKGQRGKRIREQESEEGASSPFYNESGIPGCCLVTVGQSLEEMELFHNGS